MNVLLWEYTLCKHMQIVSPFYLIFLLIKWFYHLSLSLSLSLSLPWPRATKMEAVQNTSPHSVAMYTRTTTTAPDFSWIGSSMVRYLCSRMGPANITPPTQNSFKIYSLIKFTRKWSGIIKFKTELNFSSEVYKAWRQCIFFEMATLYKYKNN